MNKTQRTWVFFWLCFLLPLGLAYLILKMGWFTPGVKSHGEWLTTDIVINEWPQHAGYKWGLVFFTPEHCTELCQQAERGLSASHATLGKHAEQVKFAMLSANQHNQNAKQPQLQYWSIRENLNQPHLLDTNAVYLLNPEGRVLLRYPLAETEQQNFAVFAGILLDLKKLLNYQRRPV